jgi:hypothetical protein
MNFTDTSRRSILKKRIFNVNVYPYFTLPNGITITPGGSMDVLNEDLLDSPIVKRAVEEEGIRIEDVPQPPKGGLG